MGFLRRLLGGGQPSDAEPERPAEPAEAAEIDAAEREHELEVLREEQGRLDDLAQRQLKYAHYAWQPPAQGGARRADDTDDPPSSRDTS